MELVTSAGPALNISILHGPGGTRLSPQAPLAILFPEFIFSNQPEVVAEQFSLTHDQDFRQRIGRTQLTKFARVAGGCKRERRLYV